MVREVINNGDAVHFGDHFQAALHALEASECFLNFLGLDAEVGCHRSRSSSVEDVVGTGEWKLKFRPGLAVTINAPASLLAAKVEVARAPSGVRREHVELDRGESFREALLYIRAAVEGDNLALLRNEVDEALEGHFDCVEVFVDIGDRKSTRLN